MRLMEKEGTFGWTARSTLETGSIIKWRATEYFSGPTARSTKESSWKIGGMAMAFSGGKMVASTRDSGLMGNSMVEESLEIQMEGSKKVNGMRARGSDGLENRFDCII